MTTSTEQTVLKVLRELDRVSPTISVAMCLTLFTVAQEEGLTVQDYAQRLAWPLTTVSRQLLDLSDTPRAGRVQTLGLLHRRQDPNNLRNFRYVLSPVGRALVYRMSQALPG